MSNLLTSTERLEKVMFQSGYFTVKNVVLLGSKGANSNRLDPIYERTYPSNKYNNRAELTTVRWNQNEYVVLGYNNFEEKVNEEIFVSYPHYMALVDFFTECMELLNTQGVFTNNSVAVQYADTAIESEPFASGKRMIAVPGVWEDADTNVRKGIFLFLNSEDVATQIEITGVSSLLYILETFNLSIASNQLLIMGMLNDLAKGGIQTSGNRNFQSSSTQTSAARTGVGGAKRGLFGNSNSRKSGLGSKVNAQQPVDSQAPAEEDGNIQEPEKQERPKRRLSMNAINQKASEIEVEDMGEVQI